MQTVVLPTDHTHALPAALKMLTEGGLVAFPTDTVYGLGARIDLPLSIERLYQAKDRETTKSIAVLLGDVSQLELLTDGFNAMAMRLAERFWPGPLTLVIPRNPALPDVLSSNATVGVRMPDHPFALTLLRQSGPLATTSANRSGRAKAVSAGEALEYLCGRVELILDGGKTPGGVPSTVVDCTGAEPVILREGPIQAADLAVVLS